MDIFIYDSVGSTEVKKCWQEYFTQPSAVTDYYLACNIEHEFISDPRVLVFKKEGKIRGILPICGMANGDEYYWTHYPSLTYVASSVTIDAECWQHLPKVLPRPFYLQESSWKNWGSLPDWVQPAKSNVIDLSIGERTLDGYLATLTKKHRSKLRNSLNRNVDIKVVRGEPEGENFEILKQTYLNHCYEHYQDSKDLNWFRYQMQVFPQIFKVAADLGQLLPLKFYLNDELVAVNYCIVIGDSAYDYICYRNPEFKDRSLGIFAILENIRYIQANYKECIYYDLASEFEYKSKFLNCAKQHAVFSLT